jgi:D-threo-aldose 1-dehydrogenase
VVIAMKKMAFPEEIMPAGQIEKIKLGRTGFAVSKLCFGTSVIGNMPETFGYAVDDARARATLKAVFASPVNFLDTARIYGHGRAEARVGEALKEVGGLPEGFVITSKVDRDFKSNVFDGARVRRSLEESFKALGLDYLPLVNLHDPEYAANGEDITGPGGALSALFKLKEEGLVGAVGLAAGRVDLMMPLLRDWDFDAIMTHNRFTLPNRNAEAMIDFCVGKGIAVLNAAPYASGVLAKGSNTFKKYAYQDASEAMLDPIRRIEEICARYGVPTGAAALQFSMRDPRVTSTVIGVSKPERIAQTLEWANWPVPDAAWDELLALPFATDDPEATRKYASG